MAKAGHLAPFEPKSLVFPAPVGVVGCLFGFLTRHFLSRSRLEAGQDCDPGKLLTSGLAQCPGLGAALRCSVLCHTLFTPAWIFVKAAGHNAGGHQLAVLIDVHLCPVADTMIAVFELLDKPGNRMRV